MKKFTLSLAALLLAGSSAFAHLNTVTNGGFEFGELKTSPSYDPTVLNDWYWYRHSGNTVEGSLIELSTEEKREGKNSIKVTVPEQTMKNRYDFRLAQRIHRAVEFGKTIAPKLTFFAKTDQNIKLNIYYTAGSTTTGTVIQLNAGSEWKSYTATLPANTALDYEKEVQFCIGIAPQTIDNNTIIYLDDVYVGVDFSNTANPFNYYIMQTNGLNTGLFRTTPSGGNYSCFGFSGLFGPGAGATKINSDLADDRIEGDKSIVTSSEDKDAVNGNGFEILNTATPTKSDAMYRVSFYAKNETPNTIFRCYNKGVGKDSVILSENWEKYNILLNVVDNPNIKDTRRFRLEWTKSKTYIDYINIDTIVAGSYRAPVVKDIPTDLTLDLSREGLITPTVDAYDFVKFAYTCSDKDLTITRDGRYGVKLSSSVEKNYTLNVKYTDNLTTVTTTVAVKVGNPTNLNNPLVDGRFTIEGSKLIVKADQAEVTINQVNGMVNTYKVAGESTISLSKGINIITIKEADQQPVTVKVGI